MGPRAWHPISVGHGAGRDDELIVGEGAARFESDASRVEVDGGNSVGDEVDPGRPQQPSERNHWGWRAAGRKFDQPWAVDQGGLFADDRDRDGASKPLDGQADLEGAKSAAGDHYAGTHFWDPSDGRG